MNIKISKEEHDFLSIYLQTRYVVGSHLYGTNTVDSDEDILCIYDRVALMGICPMLAEYLPNYHQFQYDDVENKKQYIWTTSEQFYKNLYSGDSTINADVIMFHNAANDPLRVCRTYKVIKAFIGLANRDLKDLNRNPNKLFHAHRSLYCAQLLLSNQLPIIGTIKSIADSPAKANDLFNEQKQLREWCNSLYESGELEMYYIPALPKSLTPQNTLLNKLIRSNNTKEFKYN